MALTHLRARRATFEAGFSVCSQDLAAELAAFLVERGWTVEYLEGEPRLTMAEREYSLALFREYTRAR